MRNAFTTAAILLTLSAAAFGQMSTQEAMAKLKAKEADRAAARAKPVTITQGEYDDLKAEISRLRAQLEALQAKAPAATAPAAIPVPAALTVGLTREQVMRFIQVRHETYEVKTDDTLAGGGKGVMAVVQKAKHKVFDGSFSYNGQTHFANYREQLRPDMEYDLTVAGGKVTAVDTHKIIAIAPDEIAPVFNGRRGR